MKIHNDMKGDINGTVTFTLEELKMLHNILMGSEPFEKKHEVFLTDLEYNISVMIINMEAK